MLAAFIAAVFVVLWSTGFVVARAITPYADPNLFLLARFGGTALIFALAALIARAVWPTGRDFGKHLAAGALLQGVYLGAGYWAVAHGMVSLELNNHVPPPGDPEEVYLEALGYAGVPFLA